MSDAVRSNRLAPAARLPVRFAGRRIHMIGIGGCGMCGAAAVLMQHGATVCGSDESLSATLERLRASGASIFVGHDHRHLDPGVDLVVASAAIPSTNPELLAAQAQGKPVISYAELLGRIMESTVGVAIAGTHGKSTTTAWTAFAARRAGLSPSFIVGAEVPQLGGGSGVGSGAPFIVEACEYSRSFHHLTPRIATILNIEEDHLDYFAGLDDILGAFRHFASLVPDDGLVLYNHDDAAARTALADCRAPTESFGLDDGAAWQGSRIRVEDGLPGFDIRYRGRLLGRATLAIPGRHNIYNALAAVANVYHLGGDPPALCAAVAEFRGSRRRLEFRGRFRGVDVLDDYAHHPTEIRATLQAVRQRYQPPSLWVVFQPHQVSRTRFFLEDFASSFELADHVIVPDIYFVRDSQFDRQLVSGRDLVQRILDRGGKALYIPCLEDIATHLADHVRSGDTIMTMGAGDVWKVADEVVLRLGNHC